MDMGPLAGIEARFAQARQGFHICSNGGRRAPQPRMGLHNGFSYVFANR